MDCKITIFHINSKIIAVTVQRILFSTRISTNDSLIAALSLNIEIHEIHEFHLFALFITSKNTNFRELYINCLYCL